MSQPIISDKDVCPPEDLYSNLPRELSTPEARRRAAAEWDAMDDQGRLPVGWVYGGEK